MKLNISLESLKEKALWVRKQTLLIHKIAPETRLASSLSAVEILVSLYYGKILNFDPKNLTWEGRDRLIVSKGHGSIALYPILADMGFFDKEELMRVCKEDSFLGGIPDTLIPGYETINGSLGHGLGAACGVALALKRKGNDAKVFVLIGDGELYEGSVWEAVMFGGQHRLDNIIAIIDNNKACMLGRCENIINLEPLPEKFRTHKWSAERIDGHDTKQVHKTFMRLKSDKGNKPKVLIADTVKGKGVPSLESDPMSHVKSLKPEDIDDAIARLR
ncbi:MAG: transketolase [Nitrospirae bacterium]|nr:transketolase [Nitrospirota bacterium]